MISRSFATPLSASLARWLTAVMLLLATLGPASAVTRVLFMGDSFSKGPFGRNLDSQMREAGLEVYTSVAGGASAYDWLPEFGSTSCDIGYWEKTPKKEFRVTYISRVPKINELVDRWKPNVVVIQGGTNMYSVLTSKRRPKEGNIAELERLLHRIGRIVNDSGAKLYWITPASAHPRRFSPALQAEMRSILKRVGSQYGQVYDSYAITRFTDPYPGTDGIHYGPTEATAWSRQVAKSLISYCGRPDGGRTASRASDTPRTKEARPGGSKGRNFWDIFRRNGKGADAKEDTPPAPARSRTEPPATPPAAAAPSITIRRAQSVGEAAPAASATSLQVEVALRKKSGIRNLSEITYRSALGIFEYDVIRVIRGTYTPKTIRISHLIVMNNRYTSIIDRPLGSTMTLEVELLSKYPNLEKLQTVDDLDPAYDLNIYVPKL